MTTLLLLLSSLPNDPVPRHAYPWHVRFPSAEVTEQKWRESYYRHATASNYVEDNGMVKEPPRYLSWRTHSITFRIHDAWDDLRRAHADYKNGGDYQYWLDRMKRISLGKKNFRQGWMLHPQRTREFRK